MATATQEKVAQKKKTYTPPELAREYGVSVDKVGYWILTGQIDAMNLAEKPDGKPRYKITAEAKEAFEQQRRVRPLPVATARRKKPAPSRATGYVDYFPEHRD